MADAVATSIDQLLQTFGKSSAETIDIQSVVDVLYDPLHACGKLSKGLFPRPLRPHLLLPIPNPRNRGLVQHHLLQVAGLDRSTEEGRRPTVKS